MSVLVIDIGGSQIKVGLGGSPMRTTIASSPKLTPAALVMQVQEATRDWSYSTVAIGYPGHVGPNGPLDDPGNLGSGWVGFDFAQALGTPVRIVNDAVMQALGAYHGGRMLFLGLGTGVGSALVTDRLIVALELGELPYRDDTLMHHLGRQALEQLGETRWCARVFDVIPGLRQAFVADYVVIGGGNAARLGDLPPQAECGTNDDAIEGGCRLWREDVHPSARDPQPFWRVVG